MSEQLVAWVFPGRWEAHQTQVTVPGEDLTLTLTQDPGFLRASAPTQDGFHWFPLCSPLPLHLPLQLCRVCHRGDEAEFRRLTRLGASSWGEGGRWQSERLVSNMLAMAVKNGIRTMGLLMWEQDGETEDSAPCFLSVCPSRLGCGVLPRGSTSQRSPKAEALTSPTL